MIMSNNIIMHLQYFTYIQQNSKKYTWSDIAGRALLIMYNNTIISIVITIITIQHFVLPVNLCIPNKLT